ncbi:MAG: HIT family protein [Muribaculaceae bacterium]|nr:HIT family protein [Muribaculaceae bacterium]
MTIFSKIVAGEIPCYKVAEDERYFAFLDINPITWGHTLVIPKQETDYIFDLDDPTIGDLMIFAKKVAGAIKATIPCKKIGMAVLGLEVPHAHIHLVPLKNEGDMDFKHKIENPDPAKMKELSEAISANFKR